MPRRDGLPTLKEMVEAAHKRAKDRWRDHPQWPNGPWCSSCSALITGPHERSCTGPQPNELEVFLRLHALGMDLHTTEE